MKKKDLLINFISIVFYAIIIVFTNNCINGNLEKAIITDLITGIFFISICLIKLKGIKNCIQSVEFIYGVIFWVYSIVGCIIFRLDDYQPRYYFFPITESSMTKTLNIYINIFSIYGIICCIFNRLKEYNFNQKMKQLDKKIILLNNTITIFDILSFLATAYSMYNILSYGTAFFSFNVVEKRAVLNNEISHYINLYMVIYSLFLTTSYFSKYKKNKVFYLRVLLIAIYWLIFLTCERRMFVVFFLGFIMIFLTQIKKVKFKYIFAIFLCIICFLLSASLRENITLKKNTFNDVLYMSSTEYYCTFSITNAYVVNKPELQYGKTYIYDSITKLFPKFMLENKPEDLSQTFKREYNLNVGFAYNPVAEGILNFGDYATIVVPIIMVLITIVARRLGKINLLNYVLISISSLDFCRGPFSNYFFDVVFSMILIIIFFNVKIGDEKEYEKDRNIDISKIF